MIFIIVILENEASVLKPQDCVILLKLIAKANQQLSQRELANQCKISLSEINAGIKRLIAPGLLRKDNKGQFIPIKKAAEEFFIHGLKYQFPIKLGEYTRGMVTAYAAPIFRGEIILGDDPIPVWPYAKGDTKGVALSPLYSSIPESLHAFPDDEFYNLLALVDTIRIGNTREKNIAVKLLQKKLSYE